MAFMELRLFNKGALYSCVCARCDETLYTHEWFHIDHNQRRDAMEAGTLGCDECFTGRPAADTFQREPDSYAGWYSADGYWDHTPIQYDTNRRRLERELRARYGRGW